MQLDGNPCCGFLRTLIRQTVCQILSNGGGSFCKLHFSLTQVCLRISVCMCPAKWIFRHVSCYSSARLLRLLHLHPRIRVHLHLQIKNVPSSCLPFVCEGSITLYFKTGRRRSAATRNGILVPPPHQSIRRIVSIAN